MRHAHFLVLTGRLSEFPLQELIETLRGQRKTGRLQVEFQAGPAAFYFREGALVEASMGELRDLEALSLALSLQPEDAAPFNFNPLVGPQENGRAGPHDARRTADYAREAAAHARVRVVDVEQEELAPVAAFAAGERGARSAAEFADPSAGAPHARRALAPAPDEGALFEKLERIEDAVIAQARRANYERAAYAAIIALLVLAALFWRGRDGAVIPVAQNSVSPEATIPSDRTNRPEETNVPAEDGPEAGDRAAPAIQPAAPAGAVEAGAAAAGLAAGATKTGGKNPERSAPKLETQRAAPSAAPAAQMPAAEPRAAAPAAGHVVQVRMSVERGRVLRAEVSNPQPGMAAYEALALRLARQRRFPEEFSGQETLSLKVRP